MARPPRLLIPGGYYHVTARGNERRTIFVDDADRERFLRILTQVTAETSWRIFAYCLMDNHFHLLVQTPEPNLAAGMQRLEGTYAQWFNTRHERVGHLFQGRYGAKLIRDDRQLHATIRYIVRNPVRAGLCDSPCRWRWSSHLAVLGRVASPPFLAVDAVLTFYSSNRRHARASYLAVAECADVPGEPPRRRSLASVFETARGDTAIAAAHAEGYSLREIARHLGVNASTVSRRLQRRRSLEGATLGV